MDELKKSIRPKLNLVEVTTEIEQFQNDVLRPILKLQHNVLLMLFVNFSKKQKFDISSVSKEKLSDFLKKATEKNIVFRNQLIGLIIGQLIKNEFVIYSKNTSEFNKRIVTMARKRIVDSYEELNKFED